jgi:hypothetical protein
MAFSDTTGQDTRELQLSFALMLYDGFTGAQRLPGSIAVSLAAKPRLVPVQKVPEATFLFFGLAPGPYTVQVRSNDGSPGRAPQYYLPANVPITVSNPSELPPERRPIWPAFPDIHLADRGKPLDDPAQPPAYRAQRRAATLQPAVAYPFPAGATLVRGHVLAKGRPVRGAIVQRVGDDLQYPTGENGEFVLFLKNLNGVGETITLQATHALHPTVKQAVGVQRGMTVSTAVVMDS